jgi:4-hydroxysphinganine ceramide fatty acyl 2-hydroxylase
MLAGYFRHGATAAVALLVAALAAAGLAGFLSLSLGYVLVGALVFYLSEYGMHRFAFHAPPAPWGFALKLQRRLHYDHHVEPTRLDLLFLPLWFLVPNFSLVALLAWAILGAGAVASVMLGASLAVLHYEWVHYLAHIPYVPKTAWGRWLKQYHLRHHYLTEKAGFGVSNPTLDLVFGTFLDPARQQKSATTRHLFP